MLLLLAAALAFAPRVDIAVAPYPTAIAAADFDRDGRADLATVHADTDEVWVLLSRLTGGPARVGPLRAGGAPSAVAAADVDDDKRPDIVVANSTGNSVSVLLGRGEGSFDDARDFPVGNAPRGVAVADFDGDRHPDIAAANLFDDTVSILSGVGDGTFQPGAVIPVAGPAAIAAADLERTSGARPRPNPPRPARRTCWSR
jgi:hypothetical protein